MDERKPKNTGLSAYKLVSETLFVVLALGAMLVFLAAAVVVLLFETNNLYKIIYLAIIVAGYHLLANIFRWANNYAKSKF